MWRLSAVLLLLACSAPAPPPDLARAERHERAGQDQAALAAYEAAVASCPRERDAERRRRFCADALLGRAETLERLGRRDDAALAYEAVSRANLESPEPEAESLVAAARLRLELGQDARAYDLLWRAVTAYPDASAAEDALRLVVRDGRRRDAPALARVLAELYPRLAAHAIADNLLWSLADLAEHELADPARALAHLDNLAEAHPDSTLFDDAIWHAGRLARAAGDPAGAVARYQKLLRLRESSFIVGSYNSVWMDDAQLALGVILRDELGRPKDAVAALERLAEHYPESILRDDALYELAVTHERLGDAARACRALAALGKFQDSKYRLEQAPELARRLGCR